MSVTYVPKNPVGGDGWKASNGVVYTSKAAAEAASKASTPSTPTATTPKTTTTTSSSSSSSKNSTYNTPSTGKIDTTGLTGYALAYANAINSGSGDVAAHQQATASTGGTGIPGLTNPYQNPANNPYLQPQTPEMTFQEMMDYVLGMMPQAPPREPTLSYAEAQQMARDFYDPMYGDLMEQALNAVDQNNIKRGFFGQLPGAALARSTAADVENKKAQAIGQFANQLVGQSQQNALGLQQAAQQQYQTQANALLNALTAAVGYQQGNQGNMINLYNALINQQRADQERDRDQIEMLQWLFRGGGY